MFACGFLVFLGFVIFFVALWGLWGFLLFFGAFGVFPAGFGFLGVLRFLWCFCGVCLILGGLVVDCCLLFCLVVYDLWFVNWFSIPCGFDVICQPLFWI